MDNHPALETQITIGVLGLGHVGLITALGFAEVGWEVVGVDDNHDTSERLAWGDPHFYEPGLDDLLRKHLDSGQFQVKASVADAVQDSTVLFVCVGTPNQADGSVDLSQMDRIARQIAPQSRSLQVDCSKEHSAGPHCTACQGDYCPLFERERFRGSRKPGVPQRGDGYQRFHET